MDDLFLRIKRLDIIPNAYIRQRWDESDELFDNGRARNVPNFKKEVDMLKLLYTYRF